MDKNHPQGFITVFFTFLSTLYLALMFLLAESVRIQGARAHTEQIAWMGNYSLLSEYENKLLTDFDVFGLDGSYGTGDFHIDRVEERLQEYLEKNANPRENLLTGLCFDPWRVELTDQSISDYSLLSDGNGEAFYQQAVAYMRTTAITGIGWKLLRWYRMAKAEAEKQETFEKEILTADKELEELKKKEKEAQEQAVLPEGSEEARTGQEAEPHGNEPGEGTGLRDRIQNPIKALQKLRRKDLLEILCPDMDISGSYVVRGELVSKRWTKKGTLPVRRKYSGPLNNLFFKEYLLDHFVSALDEAGEGELKYELEYILAGKKEDRKNLKAVAGRLLLLREGSNYLYCTSDEGMSAAAGGLAALLIGWTQIPALSAALKHILLLGWAYGESLLDVRAVMSGGKVEPVKDEETWKLKLENLASINELLDANAGKQNSGLTYRGYLRILLYLQPVKEQKRRALDLVELRVKAGEGLSEFRADHCVTAVCCVSHWDVEPVFSKVTAALIGIGTASSAKEVTSGLSYLY